MKFIHDVRGHASNALEGEVETALRVLEDGFDDATVVLALPPTGRLRPFLRTRNPTILTERNYTTFRT